jgi:hypothetical protein
MANKPITKVPETEYKMGKQNKTTKKLEETMIEHFLKVHRTKNLIGSQTG